MGNVKQQLVRFFMSVKSVLSSFASTVRLVAAETRISKQIEKSLQSHVCSKKPRSVVYPRSGAFSFYEDIMPRGCNLKNLYALTAQMYDRLHSNACLDLSLIWNRNLNELKASLYVYPDHDQEE